MSGVTALATDAQAVSDSAYDLAEVIDNLVVLRGTILSSNQVADAYGLRLATTSSDIGESDAALAVLRQVPQAEDDATLQGLWAEFSRIHATGIDPAVSSLAEGEGIFYLRGQQLGARGQH